MSRPTRRSLLTFAALALACGSLSFAADGEASTTDPVAKPKRKVVPFLPNMLTPEEVKLGFVQLFDGRSFDGWRNPGNWTLDGDCMFRERDGGGLTYNGGRLADDFELRFEWRVARGAKSGVFYRPGQYAYQICDNDRHPDARNPRTSAGSLYRCMPPSKDVAHAAGKWNSGRIVCQGTVIQHWLNGEKIIDFDYAQERWRPLARMLADRGTNLEARGTHLHLQDHGDFVWYRSIRYRELLARDDIDHRTVTPAEISADVLEQEREEIEQQKLQNEGRRPSH